MQTDDSGGTNRSEFDQAQSNWFAVRVQGPSSVVALHWAERNLLYQMALTEGAKSAHATNKEQGQLPTLHCNEDPLSVHWR